MADAMHEGVAPQALWGVQTRLVRIETLSLSVSLLRLWRATDRQCAALADAFALPWPVRPNSTAGQDPHVLWIAPDTWAVVGSTAAEVAVRAQRACGSALYHVSDVSEGRVAYRLSGSQARTVLGKGCSLDLHPRQFAVGSCAQSLLAQVPVLIESLPDTGAGLSDYRLFADVSYEAYLRAWFSDALVEFG